MTLSVITVSMSLRAVYAKQSPVKRTNLTFGKLLKPQKQPLRNDIVIDNNV